MRSRLSTFAAGLLFVGVGILCIQKYPGDWRHFSSCPNRDVLSLDENLRMIQTLDVRNDVSHGKILRAVASIVESPTWPPLHSLIAQVVYLFTGPSTISEVAIGFGFGILAILSLCAIGFELGRREMSLWSGAFASFFTVALIFHTHELTAYSLSAMLETQGMFFFLLTCFAFYLLYSGAANAKWWILAATVGLFLTKYPYGHILLMAGGPIVLLSQPESLRPLIAFLRSRYSGKSLILPAVLIGVILILAGAKFLPGQNFNVKGFKYLFYAIALLLLVDFNWKIYSNRPSLGWMPDTWKIAYLYAAVPILAMTFVSPDRFSSTVGTQLHQQDSARSFFVSIFTALLDFNTPLFALLALGSSLAVALLFKKECRENIPTLLRNPLVFSFSFVLMHLLILEFLTANKQLRHIYHILPALIFFGTLLSLRNASRFRYGSIVFAGLLATSLVPVFAAPSGLFSARYFESRYVCWTGTDAALFDPVRRLTDRVDRDSSYILINRFHEESAPLPGKQWASEFDLLLRMKARGPVRNDSRFVFKNWDEFERLLVIHWKCDDETSTRFVASRAAAIGSEAVRTTMIQGETPGLCITEYRLSKSAGKQ